MKILIIGNPIASGGNVKKKIDELSSILQARGHHPIKYLTKFAGDGKTYISNINKDIDRIVVVGGDGTLNEIINGVSTDFSIPVLQLPTGNANLLGHDLSLPRTAKGAADLIEHGQTIMADVATMNNTKFIMVAGAGFDALITEEVKKHRTGKLNNFSYIKPLFRSLKKSSNLLYEITIDEKTIEHGAMVLIANVQCYAGICKIAFEAGVDTRVLDIIIFPEINFISFMKYFLFAKFSKVTKLKGVKYYKGKSVKITSDKPIKMELDGDFADQHQEVNIELFPGSLPLIVPKN
ncbi:MAG: diacylglycerol kinase family lipid kinase, partial [Desulfobacteraceae bacterium]|nr:diacylglycerol kinase family lipid kinase [Desulfobacteraceae bacterium]